MFPWRRGHSPAQKFCKCLLSGCLWQTEFTRLPNLMSRLKSQPDLLCKTQCTPVQPLRLFLLPRRCRHQISPVCAEHPNTYYVQGGIPPMLGFTPALNFPQVSVIDLYGELRCSDGDEQVTHVHPDL